MKKIIFILLFLFCNASLPAQERMIVSLKDGRQFTYVLDSVLKLTFWHETSAEYNVMSLFSRGVIPYGIDSRIAGIDSILFQNSLLNVYYDKDTNNNLELPLRGKNLMDSITFIQYNRFTNIIELTGVLDTFWCEYPFKDYGFYKNAIWSGNRIYYSNPYGYLEVDTGFQQIKNFTFCPLLSSGISFSSNQDVTKFLTVFSTQFASDQNVSLGYLMETDLQKGIRTPLLNSVDSAISSAIYYDKNNIIYYSYGNSNLSPGYYFFDEISGVSNLLCPFYTEYGSDEMVNGFDISPDRKKILIPCQGKNKTFIIEYDISKRVFDTLNIPSIESYTRNGLWLRYSHDGSRILYCSYWGGTSFGAGSEIGIIDRVSLLKIIYNTAPKSEGQWISVFPNWSPDDQHIVYCAATFMKEPAILGDFEICILKSLK